MPAAPVWNLGWTNLAEAVRDGHGPGWGCLNTGELLMKMQSLKRASHMVLVAMAIKGHLCRSSSDMRITQLSSMPRQKCCDTKNL